MTRILQRSIWLSVAVIGCGVSVPSALLAGPSSSVVRLTLLNGVSQTVRLEGVGCSERLCSRIAVNTKAKGDSQLNRIPLETIAVVRDITKDGALFVFKDGTKRRLSVIRDNQVFYTSNEDSAGAKIDLAQVRSVEFLGSGR